MEFKRTNRNYLIEMSLDKPKYSETIDHLLIKKFFYDNLPVVNEIKTIEQEIKIGNRIADVYLELKDGKQIVIEIQHSQIKTADYVQRTKEYNQKGIYVLWVLDGRGPYDKYAENIDCVNITASEKELQSIYRGRVYYINASSDGISSSVYALHFTPYVQKKVSRFGIIYYKKSNKKRSAVCNQILSLKLNLFRNKGFKLAGFFDKNLKNMCISDVVQFVDNFIAYRDHNPQDAIKRFPEGLPLIILIQKFYERYGLYLLFDVLRYLKFLTMRDAMYIFENKLWERKHIFS